MAICLSVRGERWQTRARGLSFGLAFKEVSTPRQKPPLSMALALARKPNRYRTERLGVGLFRRWATGRKTL